MTDPEATTLMLETLFDVRAAVYEILDRLRDEDEERRGRLRSAPRSSPVVRI